MQLNIISFIVYIFTIVYFAMLGCIMITRHGHPICTPGEMSSKRRMTRSVGIYMLFWSFDWFVYLPPILHYGIGGGNKFYDPYFIFTLMLDAPLLFVVMHALVQKKVNTLLWVLATGLPYLLLLIWYFVVPYEQSGRLPVHLSAALSVVLVVFLFIRYVKEYRNYIRRIRSEYSETTGREIIWSWSCFFGFSLQILVFIFYEYAWQPYLEYFYLALSMVNGAYLCHCVSRQKPLDPDVVENTVEDVALKSNAADRIEEKAFYGIIEEKLEYLCEKKFLFLEPDLTREVLCRRLSISSTYLKLYFHSRGLSFYHYINTLRVEYAYRLMQENPDMPIHDVCEQSGFRSQTTFRKMFKEVMGCLPSELKKESTVGV